MTATRPQHALVSAYLDDLDRALAGTDPRERAETVAFVKEHLDDALGENPSTTEVQAALTSLGPVGAIADASTHAETASRRVDLLPLGALIAAALAMALTVLSPLFGVPLALCSLAASIVSLRTGHQRGMAWTALALSSLTLLIAAVMALTLIPVGDSTPNSDPVMPSTPR